MILSTVQAIPTPNEYFERIHRIVSLLDDENAKILNAMREHGPRNLQQIARKTGIPPPTVRARVFKLEGQGILHTWIWPDYSKIGLQKAMVVVTPAAGKELLAREALRIPGNWLRIIRCLGDCNGYYSLHAIPDSKRQEFEQYLDQLVALGVASSYRIFWLGETHSPLPNFEYYDAQKKTWKFDWPKWLESMSHSRDTRASPKTPLSSPTFDKRDLVILKELEKNGRMRMVEIAKLLGVTLPAVKYRFDNLVKRGFVVEYVIDVLPYAMEVSELLEVRLDFADEEHLENAMRVVGTLPFVRTYSTLKARSSLSLRAYLPREEMSNFLQFLSALTRRGVLDGFYLLILEPMSIQAQTLGYKAYSDDLGWHYDGREHLRELRNLTGKFEAGKVEQWAHPPNMIETIS